MGSGRGETPSTSISIFPFTGGQDKSGAETWQRRPAAPQPPVARMARRRGAASRAPALLPPCARAPRSSAPARLRHGRRLGPGALERLAARPWSGGFSAPAVSLSREHPGGGAEGRWGRRREKREVAARHLLQWAPGWAPAGRRLSGAESSPVLEGRPQQGESPGAPGAARGAGGQLRLGVDV
nr:uncharacterized protein LOC104846398 [Loxodonta africana]